MFDYGKLQDPEFFKEHTLPAHSDHICYPNEEMAKRGENPFRYSLNGLWKFSYARNFTELIKDFERPETDCSGWADIRVPAHIQLEGYDTPAYVNVQYPWDGHEQISPGEIPVRFNPVGSYVKYFTLPRQMRERPLYISFQGAESGLIVWLNGHYVGYSEDSFTPAGFDLTPYAEKGENKLAVQVIKWTSGSWAEDQDFFRFSGLFRDVYLYTRPEVHVQDLKIKTVLEESLQKAALYVETTGFGNGKVTAVLRENHTRKYQLAAVLRYGNLPSGNADTLAAGTFSMEDGHGSLKLSVEDFRLWSAEEPNLYELLLTVYDARGTVMETVCETVGFRRFEKKGGVMRLNGKRIVFKGVNRHEFSSRTGRVPQEEEILKDLLTMKQNNINAIRTSHYPNDSRLYRLCDRLGLYLIDENNLESHGTWEPVWRGAGTKEEIIPNDRPEWRAMMLDRVNNIYQRDKNHPAILIWSCGNESYGGSVIREMADTFRKLDDTRLVHYEGVFHDRRYPDTSDMESQMYPSVESIKEFLSKDRSKPFICCEYAHAMGNSCGAMHKYTDLTDTELLYQGGFIWDYVDQSLDKKDRYGQRFQAYGGDFGERPTDYNFSGDGIVYGADRAPSPKMQEIKYNYQNITAKILENRVRIENKHLFLNTSRFLCRVTTTRNGRIIGESILPADVGPLSQKEYALSDIARAVPGEYAVTVSFHLKEDTLWAKAGHEIAFGQGIFCVPETEDTLQKSGGSLDIVHGKMNLGVRGKDFEALFSYQNGGLTSYRYGKAELLETIPMPNFWRAPTDNDRGNYMPQKSAQWKIASLYLTHADAKTNLWEMPQIAETENSVTVTYTYRMPTNPAASCRVSWRVTADGTVDCGLYCEPQKELGDLPEFGMLFRMNADYDHLEWYGMGPKETYADRCRGARLGIYRNLVRENLARYLKPQECGNKTGVRYAKVTDSRGRGLLFEAVGEPISFSALPWTPHELENAGHAYDLPPVHHTVVRAAKWQMGVGGDDTWGARVHPEYRIKAGKPLEFHFRFRGI